MQIVLTSKKITYFFVLFIVLPKRYLMNEKFYKVYLAGLCDVVIELF